VEGEEQKRETRKAELRSEKSKKALRWSRSSKARAQREGIKTDRKTSDPCNPADAGGGKYRTVRGKISRAKRRRRDSKGNWPLNKKKG